MRNEMLQIITAHYIDYSDTPKDAIYQMSVNSPPSWLDGYEYFIVSTCLRYEVYVFGDPGKQPDYNYRAPYLALERLMQLMCGLESEILGEAEILNQVERGIRSSYERQTLSLPRIRELLKLVEAAKSFRTKHNLTHGENYSTIAARMAKKYLSTKTESTPTILVLGAGYMSRSFLEHISVETINLIWINRSVKNIYARHIDILKKAQSFNVYPLSELSSQLQNADLIFTAIHNNQSKNIKINDDLVDKRTIDISYPVVFSGNQENLYNLENTKFSQYLLRPLSGSTVTAVNKEIANYIKEIYDN